MNKLGAIFFLLCGAAIGLGIYALVYAKGTSYLSDQPSACINCHVMRENYETWSKSTHHHVAKCNDCHLPHNIIGKYAVKALNGLNHSVAFTLKNHPDPIRIREHSLKIVQNSCVDCHQPMVQAMPHRNFDKNENANCLHCHRSVGHAK